MVVSFRATGTPVRCVLATVASLIGLDPVAALEMTPDEFAWAAAGWLAEQRFWAEVLGTN